MCPDRTTKSGASLEVNIQGVDMSAIHMIPEVETFGVVVFHEGTDDASSVVQSSWTRGLNKDVVTIT